MTEIWEVSVSQLLGPQMDMGEHPDEIAEQLSGIYEQLAIKKRRARKILKAVAIILGISVAVFFVCHFRFCYIFHQQFYDQNGKWAAGCEIHRRITRSINTQGRWTSEKSHSIGSFFISISFASYKLHFASVQCRSKGGTGSCTYSKIL